MIIIVVMNDTIKGDTMNTLEILTSKSKALADNIRTIENAGYSMTYVGELKSFVDSQRSVYVKEADNSITPFEITKYETNFIMEDSEGRAVHCILSLVSKFNGSKIKDFGMIEALEVAQAKKSTEEMVLSEMKVKIEAVEYSKGFSAWEKNSFAGLENELDELSYF
tara:strand:+ start:42 stop:539 length:498 start_codon:yes stop_codon:yes gene_type:complete